jgi:plasmid stability protein
MKNITITLDEDIARWVRIRAAEHEKSVSRLLRELLQEKMAEDRGYAQAMETFLSVRPSRIRKKGVRYPSRDEIHGR